MSESTVLMGVLENVGRVQPSSLGFVGFKQTPLTHAWDRSRGTTHETYPVWKVGVDLLKRQEVAVCGVNTMAGWGVGQTGLEQE